MWTDIGIFTLTWLSVTCQQEFLDANWNVQHHSKVCAACVLSHIHILLAFWDSSLREGSRKYLHYETKAIPSISNITHFIWKGTCIQQYPKLNPDAYTLSPTKLIFENFRSLPLSSTGHSRIRSLISVTTLFVLFLNPVPEMLSHRPYRVHQESQTWIKFTHTSYHSQHLETQSIILTVQSLSIYTFPWVRFT